MKPIVTLFLLISSLFILGCASSGGVDSTSDKAAAEEAADTATKKTAYEGSTGSGLLMERYKSGEIQGYRD